jgi:2-dehydro-3-deoxyphosphooctonate aldolase (KDO 8-P synthase)
MSRVTTINEIKIGAGHPLAVIAGPCVLEDETLVLQTAEHLARVSSDLGVRLIFKSSYEKDNRSTERGYRGPGLRAGLPLLARVRRETGLPILSDVHRETDVAAAAEVLDVVQVPAFLCRQTGLLTAVGRHARAVNLKKGQFMAPEDMAGSVDKLRVAGCKQLLLTERGSCFGYHRLVVDMTAIPVMQSLGCPVVFDTTHVVRRYGVPSADREGGTPQQIPVLARAGVAAGCDALFIETHPRPEAALCDGSSMLPLEQLPALLEVLLAIAECVRGGGAGEVRAAAPGVDQLVKDSR